jgi:hypothetical protein
MDGKLLYRKADLMKYSTRANFSDELVPLLDADTVKRAADNFIDYVNTGADATEGGQLETSSWPRTFIEDVMKVQPMQTGHYTAVFDYDAPSIGNLAKKDESGRTNKATTFVDEDFDVIFALDKVDADRWEDVIEDALDLPENARKDMIEITVFDPSYTPREPVRDYLFRRFSGWKIIVKGGDPVWEFHAR